MAEGDRFYWYSGGLGTNNEPTGEKVLIAEHKGYKFDSSSYTEQGLELNYIQTFIAYVRPELLYKLEPIGIVPNGTSLTIPFNNTVFPKIGSLLRVSVPDEWPDDPSGMPITSIDYPGVYLASVNIQTIEVLPQIGWLVTAQYSFRGFETADVNEVSFTSASEEQILPYFNEMVYTIPVPPEDPEYAVRQEHLVSALEVHRYRQETSTFFKPNGELPYMVEDTYNTNVPAINSAGSPIELTTGRRQVLITMNFFREPDMYETGEYLKDENGYPILDSNGNSIPITEPSFRPVDINLMFVDTVNKDETFFLSRTWPAKTCRLDKYDATVMPLFDINYTAEQGAAIPFGYRFRISAQITYDPMTFLRLIPDVSLMLQSTETREEENKPSTGGMPRHIWAVEVEEGDEIVTKWGTKKDMRALAQGTADAEKITTPIFLDGRGWPAELDDQTGMQKTYYRHIMAEREAFWPMEDQPWPDDIDPNIGDIDNPFNLPVGKRQGLLPTELLEWSFIPRNNTDQLPTLPPSTPIP